MTVERVEVGLVLAPRFDAESLVPCVRTDADTDEVLTFGYMNGDALERTIATCEAHD